MPRSDKNTEQILAETTRPCPCCFVPKRRAKECVHMMCGNSRCQHEFCWLCLFDWTSATYDASFCMGSVEASHLEVLAFVAVRYGFIKIRMKVVNLIKKIFIKNHFHQKPLSSKTTLIKNHSHQKTTFIKKPLSSKNHFHQKNPNPKDLNPKP